MARVTVGTIVNVSPYARVVRICLSLRMTTGAREDGIVRRIGMARCANPVRIAVTRREPCVGECCTRPRCCGVAGLTRRREPCRSMIGIRRSGKVSLVALVA